MMNRKWLAWLEASFFSSRGGWLILLAFGLPAALFTFQVAPEFISRDVWRFVDIIRNYYSGTLSLDDFWGTHSSHRTPGYKALFLLNAMWFSLDMRLEAMLGFVVHAATGLLVVKHLVSRLPELDRFAFVLGVGAIAAAWMSLNQAYFYVYSLLALSAGISAAFFVITLVYVDRYVEHRQLRDLVIFSTAWLVGVTLFGAGKTPAMAASLVFALAIHAVNRNWTRQSLVAALVISVLTIIEQVVYWIGIGEGNGPALRDFSIIKAGEFVLAGMGSATVEMNLLRFDVLSPVMAAVIVGALVALLAGLFFFEFLAKAATRQLPRSNVLFLTLLVYGFVFVVTVMFARLNWGPGVATAPRYIHESHFALVGLLGLAALTPRSRRGTTATALLFVALIGVEVANSAAAFRSVPYRIRTQAAAEQTIFRFIKGKAELEKNWLCPNTDLCGQELEFLHEHQLNVFSKEERKKKRPAEK